jgi:hypothetical protein
VTTYSAKIIPLDDTFDGARSPSLMITELDAGCEIALFQEGSVTVALHLNEEATLEVANAFATIAYPPITVDAGNDDPGSNIMDCGKTNPSPLSSQYAVEGDEVVRVTPDDDTEVWKAGMGETDEKALEDLEEKPHAPRSKEIHPVEGEYGDNVEAPRVVGDRVLVTAKEPKEGVVQSVKSVRGGWLYDILFDDRSFGKASNSFVKSIPVEKDELLESLKAATKREEAKKKEQEAKAGFTNLSVGDRVINHLAQSGTVVPRPKDSLVLGDGHYVRLDRGGQDKFFYSHELTSIDQN